VTATATRRRMRELPAWAVSISLVLGALVFGELLTFFGDAPIVPWPVLVMALIEGSVGALLAVAVVLIYRANKLITFAHGAIAAAGAVGMYTLIGEGFSYWLVIPLTLAASVTASALLEAGLLRRFATSPRLVATIATLAGGQIFLAAAFFIPQWRFDVNILNATLEDLQRLPGVPVHFPNAWQHNSGSITFTADHVVALVVSLLTLTAVGMFLRFTTAGTAIRGASENSERVALLGVSMGSLGTFVWVIAGLLAGLSTVLGEPLHNGSLITIAAGGAAGGISVMLRGFAAGVLARMERISIAVSASIAIAILDQAINWTTRRAAAADVALFIIIAAVLLIQRRGLSRVEESAATSWSAAEEIRPVPAILSALPTVQSAKRWAYTALVAAILITPFALSPSQMVTATTYSIYAIVAVSLVVLTGWGGQISLGQFGLVAVGASTSGLLRASFSVPFPIAMLVAALVATGVAVLLGLPALRIRGLYLAVTTLSFALVMSTFFLDANRFHALVPQKLNRPSLLFIDFKDDRSFFFLCVIFLVLTVLGAQGLRKTRTGRVLIAARDNESAVQSFGISLVRTRLATFALAGFIAGLAGVLLATQQQGVHPGQYNAGMSIEMFLMAIIGGLGSVAGVVTGAIYLGAGALFLHGPIGALLAAGGGVLVVLVAYPAGLGGLLFAARDAFLRRVAIREKIFVRSLLGDVRDLDSERSRAQLAPKPAPEETYELDSHIREAGVSQRSKGWVYG
jgi:branched-chain amino acid transport system permease protein